MEHPFKISDNVGIPSTIGAIFLNLMKMLNFSDVNLFLTIIISMLSIVYLIINIYIKLVELKKKKKETTS
jgi:hypothetical protein